MKSVGKKKNELSPEEALKRAPGTNAVVCCVQVRLSTVVPLNTHVSLRYEVVETFSPPNMTTSPRVASYAMAALSRAAGVPDGLS